MHSVESRHPGGTVAVASAELSRFVEFSVALARLATPRESILRWTAGVGVAENLNRCTRDMVGDWIWYMGDDHDFDPKILLNLLDRNVDIVAPLISTRKPPFLPVIYAEGSRRGLYRQYMWEGLKTDGGLMECAAVAGAGLLVRRRVIEALQDPWFEVGRTNSDKLGEDMWFCTKAREAGFKVYCDLDQPMGHMSPMTVWPAHVDGRWRPRIDLDNNVSFLFD